MTNISNERSVAATAAEIPLASDANAGAAQLLPLLSRPTNYLSVTTGGMSGDFIINPNLQIPTAFISPQAQSETKKNLSLTATHGNINAVIWLVGDAGVQPGGGAVELQDVRNRASLAVDSKQGLVTVKLRRLVPIPITLDVTSVQSCSIYLPRTFHGSLTLVGYKSITISEELKTHLTTINETSYSLQAFVGDLDGREKSGPNLVSGADQCSVNVTQDKYPMKAVDVRYEDEAVDSTPPKG